MITLALVIFWLSVALMFHSYVLFPLLLKLFAIGKKPNDVIYDRNMHELPEVYVIMSVFNEERVIKEKLESIYNTDYPLDKLHVFIGSDNSADATNSVIQGYKQTGRNLHFVPYTQRQGKPNVINALVTLIQQQQPDLKQAVFILTDANVVFTPTTIFETVKHFRNENIGLVAANILNKEVVKDGISVQEKSYIQRETNVKYLEGLNWGTMMGAFGACYAMRATLWKAIPANFIVDDFYLTMNVLKNGKQAITELNALCYEDVSNEVAVEFGRKARIQAGNFQNLATYWPMLLGFNATAFSFLSHKVIRWLGPLFIVLSYIANICLLPLGQFYVFTFVVQNLLLVSPVIDTVLKRMGLHLILLRFASYFYTMNFALALGFVNYLRGVKTNTWNPTKRRLE
ncbi:MAG: glycosyltransferase [Chitinophagales bacterium]|nr:glycosyltransferase [Chitinophagales bacterium]